MEKQIFLIKGNICGKRIRVARTIHNPPLTQVDLARLVNLQGMEMTPLIISRIERQKRHVCDAELHIISQVLDVSMEWLCFDQDI